MKRIDINSTWRIGWTLRACYVDTFEYLLRDRLKGRVEGGLVRKRWVLDRPLRQRLLEGDA